MRKLNLGAGDHPLPGFDNLDLPEWKWSRRLPCDDATVAGITVSHSLMYASEILWSQVFAEFYRVLAPGGVVRITEDATDDPCSERFGGWHVNGVRMFVTLTSAAKVMHYLEVAGFAVFEMAPDASQFTDLSLCQRWHGDPPKVFHIEGRKSR